MHLQVKWRAAVLLVLATALVMGVFFVIRGIVLWNNASVSSDNNSYTYFEHPTDTKFIVHGLDFAKVPLSQIRGGLTPIDTPSEIIGVISTPSQAAYYGASILDKVFETWTEENHIGVFFNHTANVWVVHGTLVNRYSHSKIGVVVLDANTGAAIGVTLVFPAP